MNLFITFNRFPSDILQFVQQFGDIRNIYTACKHRGFVMISYYDIRSARNAMRALQNKPLRRRKLDIHFSIPKVPSHSLICHLLGCRLDIMKCL